MRRAALILCLLVIAALQAPAHAVSYPTPKEIDRVARVVYAEARGLPARERVAIAHVIVNRWLSGRWGSSIEGVVLARRQFSATNAGDPNRPLVFGRRPHGRVWRETVRLVDVVIAGRMLHVLEDPTRGANHYWHGADRPYWAEGVMARRVGKTYLVQIGY